MDISWKKDIKYESEMNKKFLPNTSSNKNTNYIFFNSNNNINSTDISNNKKEIYTKNNTNIFIDSKNNDNFQSYHISYLNNLNNINHNQKGPKNHNTKIIHNYNQPNSAFSNNNKKKDRELSMNNKFKNNVKLINDLNKRIDSVENNQNHIIQNNEETTYFFDTNTKYLNNNDNIFTNNNSIYISSQNANKKNVVPKINNTSYYENIDLSHHNNKIKGKINYNFAKKNSRSISGSSSQQNIIINSKKLLKTEENYDNNNSGYVHNLNNINIAKRDNYAFFISPNRFNNNINTNYKISSSINKSGKTEKIKYIYQTSIFDNSNTQNNINNNKNNNNEGDFITNNNYSNINIDLYGNNDSSMNNNNYINLYLMNNINNDNNNNKLLYYQNNQNIPKKNIKGNIYLLSQNNFKSPKTQENNEILKNIKVNTTTLTRNNLLTERNNIKDTKKNSTNKSLENSEGLINFKIKNNRNNINKIINRTNEDNIYNNKFSKTKIYIKKIDMKNNKPFLYQKDNNIKNIITNNNKSPTNNNKNINKKKGNLKKQKNSQIKKNNILLEKPRNKYCFKKKYYCHNIKKYQIKKCYFIKSYKIKNTSKEKNHDEENHEVTFTEKISVLIDNNNMNTISIHNNNQNQIEEPSLIENSFKENKNQQNNNSKINSNNLNAHPQIPEDNIIKIKRTSQKLTKPNNISINNLNKEELEMTFRNEELQKNNNNSKSQTKKEDLDDEGDLYQNEDIKIMTDDEEQDVNEEDNLRITQGKEIVNNIINPDKINKGLELLEKIQEKRIHNKFEQSLENDEEKDIEYKNDENFFIHNDIDVYNYYNKTNTLKPKDSRLILKNLTKNKKCEILNDVLTELFSKKEKESKFFDIKTNSIMNYNPLKIEKYEKIFNQEQIQNLELILNKKKLDKMFDFLYDKDEIMNEIKSSKKSVMTYNKKFSKKISTKILEESYNEENTSIISNKNKIVFSLEYILDMNNKNELCKKDNLLPLEFIEHCNEILNNYETVYKKGNTSNKNINRVNNDIEKWSRKDINPEIKKAEEYIAKMNIDMSKNNYKYEIIENLNILTVDNYNEIFNKLSNIVFEINNFKNVSAEILLDNQFRFSEIIIEKAILEKGYVKLYAKICYDLFIVLNKYLQINSNPNNTILKNSENLESLLISQCKQKFNDYQYNKNNDTEENFLIKKKFLGTVNFICELIDVKLFSQKIGFEFLDILYKNYKNECNELNYDEKNKNLNLEGCITLLNKFGKIVFEEKNEKFLENLDYYMKECIIPIIKNNNDKNIPDYIKYKIINLIEKQKNNWEESMFEKSILAKGKNSGF